MPKDGFRSITVSEQVYKKFYNAYEKNKDKLALKGINSFAGYITFMMEERMQKDETFARYSPKLEKIAVDDNRIILKDNVKNRVAEVAVQNGELYCLLCEEKDCFHVGFAFALPEIYQALHARGIKRQP